MLSLNANPKQGSHADQSPTRDDHVLLMNKVNKHFGNVHVVKDLNLEIKRGEILTLLGPSGCGKTTTLRMAIGLEKIDGGEITYNGKIIDSKISNTFVPTNKRKMGMVFQSYAIWPQMTVFENVAYPMRVMKQKKDVIKREVMRVLELVGLGHLPDRPAPMLSGGQQQRVAFARSLVFSPDILLLDEPFSNLDAQLREHMRIEVKELQKRIGITVLFVTHDQIEALSLSDRIGVMNGGRIEQIGSPEDVYHRPVTTFVRDFLGKSILLPCKVAEKSAEGYRLSLNSQQERFFHASHPLSDDLSVGESAVASLRPEHISAVPYTETRYEELSGQPDINAMRCQIDMLFFVGNGYETTVTLQGSEKISLFLPHHQKWSLGQDIILTFPREDTRLWKS